MRNPPAFVLAGLLIAAVIPVRAHAQDEDTPTPIVRKQVVSANPWDWMHGSLNAEYERQIGPTSTWGVSGSSSDYRYIPRVSKVNLMLRYYPHGAALEGFYVGATAGGYTTANRRIRVGGGYELGYAWLVGPKRNISLNLRGARLYGVPGPELLFPRGNIGVFSVGFAF
jgi:hypothetical protein